MEGSFAGGARGEVHVGGAKLEQSFDDFSGAMLDGVVEREGGVEVESLAHDHELDELHVRRVERAAHPSDAVVVVEIEGRREKRGAAGEGGFEAEVFDVGK